MLPDLQDIFIFLRTVLDICVSLEFFEGLMVLEVSSIMNRG